MKPSKAITFATMLIVEHLEVSGHLFSCRHLELRCNFLISDHLLPLSNKNVLSFSNLKRSSPFPWPDVCSSFLGIVNSAVGADAMLAG